MDILLNCLMMIVLIIIIFKKNTNPLIYRLNINKNFNGSQFCSTHCLHLSFMDNGVNTLTDYIYFKRYHSLQ